MRGMNHFGIWLNWYMMKRRILIGSLGGPNLQYGPLRRMKPNKSRSYWIVLKRIHNKRTNNDLQELVKESLSPFAYGKLEDGLYYNVSIKRTVFFVMKGSLLINRHQRCFINSSYFQKFKSKGNYLMH